MPSMTDPTLAALDERHVPVYPPNYKANEGPSCQYDRTMWPCDARIALDAMAEVARKAAAWDENERVARMFHEAYERLAPDFGYETRRESAVPWEAVPEQNRALMVATVAAIAAALEQGDE